MLAWVGALVVASVVQPELAVVGDVKPEVALTLGDALATKLRASGVQVIGPHHVESCSPNDPPCIAQLAASRSAEAVVLGEVARTEQGLQLTVRVFAADGEDRLYSTSYTAKTVEELEQQLTLIATEASSTLKKPAPLSSPEGVRGPPVPSRFAVRKSPSAPKWSLVGIGAVAAVAGVVFLGLSTAWHRALLGEPTLALGPVAAREQGSRAATFGTAGIALVAGGLLLVLVGLLWQVVG